MKPRLYWLVLIAAAVLACRGRAVNGWQERGLGPRIKPFEAVRGGGVKGFYFQKIKPVSWAAGALGGQRLQMELDGEWPRLVLKPGLWAPWTIELGTAAPKGVKPVIDVLKKEPVFIHEGDWTSVQASLPCELAAEVGAAEELLPDDEDLLVRYYFTRLAPAIVVESGFSNLQLFGGAKRLRMLRGWEAFDKEITGPSHMAWAAAGKAQVEAAPCEVEFGQWSSPPWMLVWFGSGIEYPHVPCNSGTAHHGFGFHDQHWDVKPYEADCPYLIVFEHAPLWAVLSPDGLGLEFADEAGKTAVMPLRGAAFPRRKEVESWRFGLPPEVARECEYWAKRCAMLPWRLKETYSRDAERDETTVACEFSYLRLGEGGEEWAPLAPTLALALEQGFPVRLANGAAGRKFLTHYGPLVSIDGTSSYKLVFAGLGKYARETRHALPATAESEISLRLKTEIGKVLEAGHLAPWMPLNSSQTHWEQPLFSNPADTLYCLSEVRQLLDAEMRGRLDAYLKAEQAAFPAQATVVTPFLEGARRERYPAGTKEVDALISAHVREFNFHVKNGLVPVENLHALARFHEALEIKPQAADWEAMQKLLEGHLLHYDWATKGFLLRTPYNVDHEPWVTGLDNLYGYGGAPELDSFFAGLVGFIRLARLASDAEAENTGWGLFAQSAAQRFAHGRKYAYDYGEGLMALPDQPAPYWQGSGSWVGDIIVPEWLKPVDDIRCLAVLDEFRAEPGNYIYRPGVGPDALRAVKLTPELGRFYRDFLQPEFSCYLKAIEHNSADWYAWQGEQYLGNDNNYIHPSDTRAVFLARAWILDESAESLRKWLDISPLARGDIDYILKLAEIELRLRGHEWR